MKLKPPTGNGPLARAYRLANNLAWNTEAEDDEDIDSYCLLAALAARQFWAYEWRRRFGLSRCQAAWEARRQADLWYDEVERLSKESKP